MKENALFVCVKNSARSQMAEAWCNHLFGDILKAESAGLEPGMLDPLAVEAMMENGIDISGKTTRGVSELVRQVKTYTYVITVCDKASAEQCPVFPAVKERLHWSFEDPSGFSGSREEKIEKVGAVRDAIRSRIEAWGSGLKLKEMS